MNEEGEVTVAASSPESLMGFSDVDQVCCEVIKLMDAKPFSAEAKSVRPILTFALAK